MRKNRWNRIYGRPFFQDGDFKAVYEAAIQAAEDAGVLAADAAQYCRSPKATRPSRRHVREIVLAYHELVAFEDRLVRFLKPQAIAEARKANPYPAVYKDGDGEEQMESSFIEAVLREIRLVISWVEKTTDPSGVSRRQYGGFSAAERRLASERPRRDPEAPLLDPVRHPRIAIGMRDVIDVDSRNMTEWGVVERPKPLRLGDWDYYLQLEKELLRITGESGLSVPRQRSRGMGDREWSRPMSKREAAKLLGYDRSRPSEYITKLMNEGRLYGEATSRQSWLFDLRTIDPGRRESFR
ncbi:hypothetical protein [Botrimarina sp.]|uniref:hypothetical protein n=1 Tax=Botrimarina sp. TaxID=2795802 RepID=UPI0032EB617A